MSEKIRSFQDLIAWQKARILTARIYRATAVGSFARDFGLKDQIRRAAVSVMSNIAEGFERGRPSEFHQFLSIAKGSCAELRSQLFVAFDAGYLKQADFDGLMDAAVEVARIIGGLRAGVQRKKSQSSVLSPQY
ncbi:MAG TPA: four helix bundle protein [Pyrinomonadaceae bacterium]|jgi:four helix bundle protein